MKKIIGMLTIGLLALATTNSVVACNNKPINSETNVIKYTKEEQIIAKWMSSQTNAIVINKNSIQQDDVIKKITTILKDLNINTNFIKIDKNTAKFIPIEQINYGELTFQIKDIRSGYVLKNIQEKTDKFKIKFTNSELANYQDLKSKLDDFTNQKEPSLSLQNIKLINFIPEAVIKQFSHVAKIKNLLNNITLGNFVDWFFNPNGKYAKLMPRVMPQLTNNNEIDADIYGTNKDLWNYFNNIKKDLENEGIFVDKGNLKVKLNSKKFLYKINISFDLYDLIKNISPDLIHFHNYIINNTTQTDNKSDKNNYLLLFIKYLKDKPQDYSISADQTDGFSKINNLDSKDAKITDNFDNLIYDILDPFKQKSENDAVHNSSITPLKIEVTKLLVLKETINWNSIAWSNQTNSQDPSKVLFTNLLNQILAPEIGAKITEPINFTIKIGLNFVVTRIRFPISSAFNFNDLQIVELKTLIKNNLKYGNIFENATYNIFDGHLFLQGYKNNQWIKIHSLEKILDCSDIRFNFENIKFTIASNKSSNISLDYTFTDFYLTL